MFICFQKNLNLILSICFDKVSRHENRFQYFASVLYDDCWIIIIVGLASSSFDGIHCDNWVLLWGSWYVRKGPCCKMKKLLILFLDSRPCIPFVELSSLNQVQIQILALSLSGYGHYRKNRGESHFWPHHPEPIPMIRLPRSKILGAKHPNFDTEGAIVFFRFSRNCHI